MKRRPLVTEGAVGSALDVKHDRATAKLEMSINCTDSDRFRSFMMELRPFVSDGEPIFIPKVHNHLWARLTGDGPRLALKGHQASYNARMKKKVFAPAAASGLITNRDLMDAYVNGVMFHVESEKAEALKELTGTEGEMFAEIEFQETTKLILHYVDVVADVISTAKRSGSL